MFGSPYDFIFIVERTSELLKSQARSAGGRPPVVVLAVDFIIRYVFIKPGNIQSPLMN